MQNEIEPRSASPEPDRNLFRSQITRYKYSQVKDTSKSPRSTENSGQDTGLSITPSSSRRSSRKRKVSSTPLIKDEHLESKYSTELSSDSKESPTKKRRSNTKQRSANDPYNPKNNLVDSLRPGLILVFIGLNPGLTTAATGHAYAHPSNRFWHLLYESGITSQKHKPSETRNLMDLYQIGNTNICARPTRSGDGLTKEEMIVGAGILEEKIAEMKPEAVCIVGKSIWEAIWLAKTGKKLSKGDFRWGWQDEDMWLGRSTDSEEEVIWKGSRTFVATSTSGLAATLTPAEKLEIWKPLGTWFAPKRGNLAE